MKYCIEVYYSKTYSIKLIKYFKDYTQFLAYFPSFFRFNYNHQIIITPLKEESS